MTFVTVGLLVAGAACMAVPVIIHLLSRQRRRPVEWAAMRFLIEALRKHRWRMRLEQMLLLAVRCAIPLCLGAALARPVLEASGMIDTGGLRVALLVIDNGLASGARLEAGQNGATTVLERSVRRAVELVRSLRPGDQVGVITAARPAARLVVPPSGDHAGVMRVLESIAPQQSPTDLPATMELLRSVLSELSPDRDRTLVYLLSDFRRGQANLEAALPSMSEPLGPRTQLLAAPAAPDPIRNVQVTSVSALRGLVLPRSEEGAGQVTVELSRSGDLARDATRVRLAGATLPALEPRVVTWEPGRAEARADFPVELSGPGEQGLALSGVIDEDALAADNQRHTVLATRTQLRVLLLERRSFGPDPEITGMSAGQWIRRALEPSERSPLSAVDVDPAALEPLDVRGVDVAFLVRPDLLVDEGWRALRAFVDGGGLLIVTPPAEANVHPWTDRLNTEMDLPWRIAMEAVDLPDGMALAAEQPASELLRMISAEIHLLVQPVTVSRVLPVDPLRTRAERVLDFADGTPAMIASSPGRAGRPGGEGAGLVVYLAFSPQLDWTNLPAEPLMVALIQETVRQGVGLIRTGQRYVVGERPPLGLRPSAAKLIGPDGAAITLDAEGRPRSPFTTAGIHSVVDQAGQPLGAIAVNVDPASGRTDPQDPAAVAEWLARSGPWKTFSADDPGADLRTAETGSPLAGLLLAAALALVVLETALARWFSHAAPPGGRGEPEFAAPRAGAPIGAT